MEDDLLKRINSRDRNLLVQMALDFSRMTERPVYFYDIDNYLYKADNGEVTRLSKAKPEKVEATIVIDDAEEYIKELQND